jgi:RNA polymerase sigma-70 factor (ECF subfamily)
VPLPDQDDAGVVPATLAATPDPETASIEDQERRRLARLLAGLGAEHREVLLLREMEDLSYREIAAVTQLPIGTVMSRLARARAALKVSWLKDSAGEPRAVR